MIGRALGQTNGGGGARGRETEGKGARGRGANSGKRGKSSERDWKIPPSLYKMFVWIGREGKGGGRSRKNIVRRLSRAGREGQVAVPGTPAGEGQGRRAAQGLGEGRGTGPGLPGASAPGGRRGRLRRRAERGAPPREPSLN